MNDIIVLGIIIGILVLASAYIIIQKRKGVKCVGCSSAKSCSKKCSHKHD